MSIVYLDDWLLLGHSTADCKLNKLYTIKLIKSLGFTIYGKKLLQNLRTCSPHWPAGDCMPFIEL
nr:unnamed protein product [Callosobruchus chinensis]